MLDAGTWRPLDETLSPVDPLQFTDQKPYTDRIVEAQAKTGLQDGLRSGTGLLHGIPGAARLPRRPPRRPRAPAALPLAAPPSASCPALCCPALPFPPLRASLTPPPPSPPAPQSRWASWTLATWAAPWAPWWARS